MTLPAGGAPSLHSGPAKWRYVLEVLIVLAIFAAQAPWGVPDSNEPHYLAKARHYWDSSWLPGDRVLDTADTHFGFYLAFGWVTRWLSLEQAAWAGRLLTWGLLAWAWTRLSWRVIPRAWMAPASAGLFVAMLGRTEMAGEWILGGCEAKGFAYVLVFFGLGSLVRGGWNAAWLFFGAAAAFHVLVGGWCCVAAAVAWLLVGRHERSLRSMLPGMLGGAALSLAGVLPGLALSRGVTADEAAQANEIQVYERLSHHLYLPWFPKATIDAHLFWVALWALFLAVVYLAVQRPAGDATEWYWPRGWFTPGRLRGRLLGRRGWRLHALVAGALTISVLGALLAVYVKFTTRHEGGQILHSRLGTSLLRFYWFRLGDIMLPAGVALAMARMAAAGPARGRSYLAPLAIVLCLGVAHLGLMKHQASPPPAFREGPAESYADWKKACEWAKENTPADAVFLIPMDSTTFRWYAERADVANFKDMPQDPKSLLAWWNTLIDLHYDSSSKQFRSSLSERTPAELRRMGEKYGATYLLSEAEPAVDLPIEHKNGWFVIYRLDAAAK